MEKYKNENMDLLRKIKQLEQTIILNTIKFEQQKKDSLLIQSNLKKENFDYNSQIIDLQNKIGKYFFFIIIIILFLFF